MFGQIQTGQLINIVAPILGAICLLGSLYLLWAAYKFDRLTARDGLAYLRVRAIQNQVKLYGTVWFLLMGITWFVPVIHRIRKVEWWSAVYSHAEWVFRVAAWYEKREKGLD